MNIKVGTDNESKRGVVESVLKDYVTFYGATVMSVNTASGVPRQPIGYKITREGAENRAKAAYESGAIYGFGLESGLVRNDKTYVLQCIAIIYDGRNYYEGRSSIRRLPEDVIDMVLDGDLSINDVYKKLKRERSPSFFRIRGMATEGTSRKKQFRQAVKDAIRQYLSDR